MCRQFNGIHSPCSLATPASGGQDQRPVDREELFRGRVLVDLVTVDQQPEFAILPACFGVDYEVPTPHDRRRAVAKSYTPSAPSALRPAPFTPGFRQFGPD